MNKTGRKYTSDHQLPIFLLADPEKYAPQGYRY